MAKCLTIPFADWEFREDAFRASFSTYCAATGYTLSYLINFSSLPISYFSHVNTAFFPVSQYRSVGLRRTAFSPMALNLWYRIYSTSFQQLDGPDPVAYLQGFKVPHTGTGWLGEIHWLAICCLSINNVFGPLLHCILAVVGTGFIYLDWCCLVY